MELAVLAVDLVVVVRVVLAAVDLGLTLPVVPAVAAPVSAVLAAVVLARAVLVVRHVAAMT